MAVELLDSKIFDVIRLRYELRRDKSVFAMSYAVINPSLLCATPDIPVIVSTGHSDRMDEHEAIKPRAKAFIVKPLNREELAKTGRRVLNAAGNKK